MNNNCSNNNTLSRDYTNVTNKIPLMRYQKDPVVYIDDLYIKYPEGGEFGSYAFVKTIGTFAYWDIDEKSWLTLSKGDLQSFLQTMGIDPDFLEDGDVPIWDESVGKFTIIKLGILGIEEY